jgi:hypothetical protein
MALVASRATNISLRIINSVSFLRLGKERDGERRSAEPHASGGVSQGCHGVPAIPAIARGLLH